MKEIVEKAQEATNTAEAHIAVARDYLDADRERNALGVYRTRMPVIENLCSAIAQLEKAVKAIMATTPQGWPGPADYDEV